MKISNPKQIVIEEKSITRQQTTFSSFINIKYAIIESF